MKKVSLLICYCVLINTVSSSTLATPPLSAVIVTFDKDASYDISLLANTVSDQSIDTTLILPSTAIDIYEKLIDVDVIKLNDSFSQSTRESEKALVDCENFYKDSNIREKINEIQPTFTIFPVISHDACLLPWAKFIKSIPVLWLRNEIEELYILPRIKMALPVSSDGFWRRLSTKISVFLQPNVGDSYYIPATRLAKKYLDGFELEGEEDIYSNVNLILSNSESVLRRSYAPLNDLIINVGCHHCRGPEPLPSDLQKELIEHRTGTIVALLDESYKDLIIQLAEKLPQGRQGQALLWKTRLTNLQEDIPENLLLFHDVDRQDLIGYPRTRLILSHCKETEVLEAGLHGTPVICFPRNSHERKTAERVVEWDIGTLVENSYSPNPQEIYETVKLLHESARYRENAREVSLVLRDTLNPTVDKLIYSLRYIERNKDLVRKFSTSKSVVTYNEDIQFIYGFSLAIFLCLLIAFLPLFQKFREYRERSVSRRRVDKAKQLT